MAKIYILEERTEVITQLPQISSEGKKRIRKGGGVLPGSHNRHDVDLPLEPQRPLGPCVGWEERQPQSLPSVDSSC